MTDRALVIGLDYDNDKWELRAAVRDALRFADWVTEPGAGRATPDTLTLLLAPHPDRPVAGPKYELATENAIRLAMYQHEKLDRATTDRFWFFYAGHGLAPAGGGPDEAPVVVPVDVAVRDLDFYRSSKPIELGNWIRRMQVCAPNEQVYFVDACRGIVVNEDVVTATTSLFFDLRKVQAASQARQAVLFATTAGQLANEQRLHGLFSSALLDGLNGRGPRLEPDAAKLDFTLNFSALLAFTKQRIQDLAKEAQRQHQNLPTQDPAESFFRTDGSMVVARFKSIPTSKVRVFVDPDDAAENGSAGIRTFNTWKKTWERQEERSKPLTAPVEWDLHASAHRIEIEADGFENWGQVLHVIGPVTLNASLVRKPMVGAGLESMGLHHLRLPTPPPDGAELAPGKHGRLEVDGGDRYARIEVFDEAGKRIAAAWQSLAEQLPVGAYRVEIALPSEPRPLVKSVLLTAGEHEKIHATPDPQLAQRLPPLANVDPKGGFTEPSEQFGRATTTHLGSLLAWAAWAAQFPQHGDGRKLRALGVDPLPPGGACFVRVLVGDAHAPGVNPQRGPIETVALEMPGSHVALRPVPALTGFAVQWAAPLSSDSLTVSADSLSPKRFPLPHVPNHVWTIVIVRESSQRTEIHRYLQPLAPAGHFDDTIRLVEQGWRALEARTPLFENESEMLLGRDLDALSLVVLGYRCAREERREDLTKIVARLANSQLADRHVLAALLENRDANMKLAIGAGSVPIVGEGYRLMEEWLVAHYAKENMPPPIAPEAFTGGLWTAFDPGGQAVISKAFPVGNAPAWARPLLAAAEGTARVEEPGGPPGSFIGSGFLLAPRALVTTDFVTKLQPRIAMFGGKRVDIEHVVAESKDELHGALVRLRAPAPAVPLKARWALPEVGTKIAVVGHPIITSSPTLSTIAAFTTLPTGEKMIMPGVITEVAGDKLTYECWTMGGVAGGPILDLATGEVIGLHHSGKYLGGGRKIGWGTPLVALRALLETPI